ncbi:hydrogenase expression/formation protein HypE [Bradyrhizobium sp. NBAIM01]|uniref:hydrogenase expression/formation protein HypE n=1 Tax=Bradyrhizobium sp. NBAIM01 TaxID=2793818 RepID=UPI001CD49F05|nr:hydrogenase expression/formation protein HypE [Bradyrhizobium sp. NBAIM01]MCA1515621.1 hydrogenase expression/formation protein HypE [Bradyrhizobium sp. NBAIM01]
MNPNPDDVVVLDHGTGAKLSRLLIGDIIGTLQETYVGELEDSALLTVDGQELAMTTDSFVVDPVIFGNGDIGRIAVCGTVNDLAVVGAIPLALTLATIVEEGFPRAKLKKIFASVRDAAREAGVRIVAGDTKVVRRGEADGVFLNTTGLGVFRRAPLRMASVRAGDRIIVTGRLGNHAVHLLSLREGLGFENRVLSDCAPLSGMVSELLEAFPAGTVRSIRDATRGGLAAVMHEYAFHGGFEVRLNEADLPLQHETVMATDMLGVNPLHLANEGCLAIFVEPARAGEVCQHLRRNKYGRHAAIVGEIFSSPRGAQVRLADAMGAIKVLDELEGAELPRLC